MATWTDDELTTIERAREVEISTRRRDGSLSPRVTIWAVRHGDDIFIRSVNGPTATWYRGTQKRSSGHIWTDRIEREVGFSKPDDALDEAVDDAYRAKYDPASSPTQQMIAPLARQTTLRLVPA